jgi:hypothetical protein
MNSGGPLDEWLTEQEAARAVNKSVRTLRTWRKKRVSPPYTYFGRTIRYHRKFLIEFFQSNQIEPLRPGRRR